MNKAQKLAEALESYETFMVWVLIAGIVLVAYWIVLDWCKRIIESRHNSRGRRHRRRAAKKEPPTPDPAPAVSISSSGKQPAEKHWHYVPVSPVVIDVEFWRTGNVSALLPSPTPDDNSAEPRDSSHALREQDGPAPRCAK